MMSMSKHTPNLKNRREWSTDLVVSDMFSIYKLYNKTESSVLTFILQIKMLTTSAVCYNHYILFKEEEVYEPNAEIGIL